MKFFYDLHIHSVLSPCADVLMTPNNIMNMASLSKLDIVAVTDHNSTLQLQVLNRLTESYDFLFVYGCELQVEGGHLLVYFKSYEDSKRFQEYLDTILIHETYDSEMYGEEVITDIYDTTLIELDYYLIVDLNTTLNELLLVLESYDCLKVAAHLDKERSSLYELIDESNYTYIDAIELMSKDSLNEIIEKKPFLQNKTVLFNSDAHQIIDINEDFNSLELESLSIDCLFEVIKGE